MYQRKKIDITLADLAQGLKFCAKAPPREQLLKEIEHLWSDGRAVLPTLSVRTGFDLLLRNLDLGDRDEIIITAVTIPHMEQIILEHGYTPVPIDFDPQDMQTSAALVERAVGPRTGALMITPLFGTRQPLDTWVDLAREHDLFLIEDCAVLLNLSRGQRRSEARRGGLVTRSAQPATRSPPLGGSAEGAGGLFSHSAKPSHARPAQNIEKNEEVWEPARFTAVLDHRRQPTLTRARSKSR